MAAFLCLTSLLPLTDFSPSLKVRLNSGNSSHSLSFQAHPSWLSIDATHGVFYYLILVLLTLVILLKRLPSFNSSVSLLCVPPAPCQGPCWCHVVSMRTSSPGSPWTFLLLSLPASYMLMPLGSYPHFLSSSFNCSPYLTSLTCRSMSTDPSFKIFQPTSLSYKMNN